MNKTPRLSKSAIEYLDYVWNFESGCTKGCSHCYAKKIATRFPDHYPNGFEPTLYPEAFCSPMRLKKPSIIGVGYMGDLFDDAIDPAAKVEAPMPSGQFSVSMSLKGWIETTIKECPQHRFLFLTKQPQNLAKWSPFPDNCWVGVSVTNQAMHNEAIVALDAIEARIKYISYEPLLERIDINESIGYTTEYESDRQREDCPLNGHGGGDGDRCSGAHLEGQGTEIGQVEGRQPRDLLQAQESRERHGQIPTSPNDGERDSLPRAGPQAGVVSPSRADSTGSHDQPQERPVEGQPPSQSGTDDVQPAGPTRHQSTGQNIHPRPFGSVSWLILGAQTKPYIAPKVEWVREIVEAADRAGIPVFLKDSLDNLVTAELRRLAPNFNKDWNLLLHECRLRQEMPV